MGMPILEHAGRPAVRHLQLPTAAKRASGVALGILLTLAVAVIFLGMVWADLGGMRQSVAHLLRLDQESWALLEQRRTGIDKATAELAGQQRQLVLERQQHEAAVASLEKRQAMLDQRHNSLEEQSRLLDSRALSQQALKNVFETMDPAKAAALLVATKDRQQVAGILKVLSQARLTLILEQMPAAAAADLVVLMMPEGPMVPEPSADAKPAIRATSASSFTARSGATTETVRNLQ